MDHLCYFCLVFVMLSRAFFIDTLWSPAGKGLTSWLSFVRSNIEVVTFPSVSVVRCGLCSLSYFNYLYTGYFAYCLPSLNVCPPPP